MSLLPREAGATTYPPPPRERLRYSQLNTNLLIITPYMDNSSTNLSHWAFSGSGNLEKGFGNLHV